MTSKIPKYDGKLPKIDFIKDPNSIKTSKGAKLDKTDRKVGYTRCRSWIHKVPNLLKKVPNSATYESQTWLNKVPNVVT